MSTNLVDQAARARIAGDLTANLCVEAGAGTGKTTVLVERVAQILRTGHATVDQMVVITFTEAAAAELAARVRQKLEDVLDTATGPERERVHTALANLHRARVETIHAFASSMLRERPVEAGLDPAFEVLDPLPAEIVFDEWYRQWLADELERDNPELLVAVTRGLKFQRIRDLVDALQRYRTLLPLPPAPGPPLDMDALLTPIHAMCARAGELLPLAHRDEVAIADLGAMTAWWRRVTDAEGAELDRELMHRCPEVRSNKGRQADWLDADACKESKTLRKAFNDAMERVQSDLRAEALAAVIPAAAAFVQAAEERRRSEGIADFDDLLEWARDLLARSPEARAYFRSRYRVILVDEFQDTDPVQADLVLCLASDDDPPATGPWTGMRPRSGSLTVVGDPKQSIYRFRSADIAIYEAFRDGPLDQALERLEQNFRSAPDVLGWVNRVFDRVLVAEPQVQVANTTLQPARDPATGARPAVVVAHETLPAGTKAPQQREREAFLMVSAIRRAVDGGWPVRDPVSGATRPAGFGDVVVLLPRRTQLEIYLDMFRRADVPARAEGGRSFFQRQEIHDLANILRAIDDPLDQISLVAALRSSTFGCTDDEIYLHTTVQGNRLDYRPDPVDSPAPVADALRLLKRLHYRRASTSLAQLVRETLETTRLVEIALTGWDGQQSAANLLKLADQAGTFSATASGGLRSFARWLVEKQASSDEAEANIAEETDDVVRLMTIHAAKGLEFPIVALANLWSRPQSDPLQIVDRATGRLYVGLYQDFTSPGHRERKEQEQAKYDAEARRLLYVAATRARDHLIVPAVVLEPGAKDIKEAAKAGIAATPTPKELLADLYPDLPTGDQAGISVLDPATFPDLPEIEPPLLQSADHPAIHDAIDARDSWIDRRARTMQDASVGLEVHPAKPDEGDRSRTPIFLGADDTPLITGGEGPPAEIGEAMHEVLELIDLNDPGDVEELARQVCTVGGIPNDAALVAELVRSCLAQPVVERARRAPRIWREVPYTRRVEDGYATGRIDLVFEEDAELVVVDWKSDEISPSQVAAGVERHRVQGEAYVASLEAATGKRVRDVVFVFAKARAEGSMRSNV